jgi:hypothetical protein
MLELPRSGLRARNSFWIASPGVLISIDRSRFRGTYPVVVPLNNTYKKDMRITKIGIATIFCSFLALGQTRPRDPAALLNQLEGSWVLSGKIAGKPTVHDVQAHWILHHEYLQIHEVSRDRDPQGGPAYEAEVLVSWDPESDQYACLWLDSTAGAALTSQVTCRAKPGVDSIPFVFKISATDSIHTTFTYNEASDTWQWLIDNVANGKSDRFADVELSRVK